ncbi:unnamed protein product [Ectocarpus sp. CCAP 1310/34]|nr:unnamed protein product [Ectocarpus sp. CCAP 1310/34]
MVGRDHQHACLRGFEPELVRLVFDTATAEQLEAWLRLSLELAADNKHLELISRLENAGAVGSRFHLAVRQGNGMLVTDTIKRGESPNARCVHSTYRN